MGKRFFFLSLALLFAGLFFGGCEKKPDTFLFNYSIESVDKYKIAVSVKSDKTYKIEEFNYFFDNIANKKEPKTKDGLFTDADYSVMRDKILQANLFQMEDAYGFDDENDSDLGEIMCQIYFASDGKEKYISVAYDKDIKFPASFIGLINYLNEFVSKNKTK